jgi:hypothetical protein
MSDVPGAHDRIRTGDLVLTKDTLCHLSYVGASHPYYRRRLNPFQARCIRALSYPAHDQLGPDPSPVLGLSGWCASAVLATPVGHSSPSNTASPTIKHPQNSLNARR